MDIMGCPKTCLHTTGCEAPVAVGLALVIDISGKSRLGPMSKFSVRDKHGNATSQLLPDYRFEMWKTFCGEHYYEFLEKAGCTSAQYVARLNREDKESKARKKAEEARIEDIQNREECIAP